MAQQTVTAELHKILAVLQGLKILFGQKSHVIAMRIYVILEIGTGSYPIYWWELQLDFKL